MDPYHVHYSSLDSLITVLIWSVLTLGLGNGLLFGIVWCEWIENDRFQTLINRLTALKCFYAILINTLTGMAIGIRCAIGPLSYYSAAFVVTLFEGLVLCGLLTLIEIGTIKFLYIVWFKSTGALSDEFFFTFFTILNNGLGIYAVVIRLMAGTWRTKSFYLLIGEDIKTFDEQEPSPLILDSIILGCLVFSLHIILYVTIFMSNLKPGGRDRSFRRGLNDFVFRLFIMVLAFLGFIPRQIRNKMDLDYFRDHRVVFVSCSYMSSLIISLVWPLLYYWRNNRWAKCMLKPLISTRAHERCRF